MCVMEQQWIEYLRKRFADRKIAPPDDLWTGIEAAMDGSAAGSADVVSRRAGAKTVSLWLRRSVAAVACVAVLVGIGWFVFSREDGSADVVELANDGFRPADVASGGLAEVVERDYAGPKARHAARMAERCLVVADGRADTALSHVEDVAAEDVRAERDGALSAGQRGEDCGSVVVRHPAVRHEAVGGDGGGLLADAGRVADEASGFSVSVYGSGLTAVGASSGNSGASIRPFNMYQDAVGGNDVMLMSAAYGTAEGNEVRVKHRQPVKLGASVRFHIAGRFGVETGMNYSYHSSDIASGDDTGGYTKTQKLHYVGVPVAVNYNIWHTDFLDVYASAGGAVEFCVSGKSHTEYVSGGKVVNTANADVSDNRPQWSLGASAGVQYNFSDVVGVYAEPGVSYYFDNGSGVTTIYKDKPFNFNLNVGLRFTIR